MEGDEAKEKGLQLRSSIGSSNKLDTLCNVICQPSLTNAKERLLLVCGSRKRILGFSSTVGAKLDWDSEEVKAGSLADLLTTLDTGKVDECRLNDALLTLGCVG